MNWYAALRPALCSFGASAEAPAVTVLKAPVSCRLHPAPAEAVLPKAADTALRLCAMA